MAVLCLGVCILLHSVSVVIVCDLLVITGDLVVLSMVMGDMSCRVISSLSIDSLFVVVLNFSVIVFVCVVLSSSPLAITIAL